MLSLLLKLLSSDVGISGVVTAVGALVLWVARVKFQSARVDTIETAVGVLADAVGEASKLTATTVDDKVALGLKLLKDYLAAHNKPALTTVEEETAKALFAKLHGDA